MLFDGKTVQLDYKDQILFLKFDNKDQSANVFNTETLNEMLEVLEKAKSQKDAHGLIMYSGKGHFVLGADITEFLGLFKEPETVLADWSKRCHQIFNGFEDLNIPTVSAINGMALGGGLEIALTTDYRIASRATKVGLPETKLGLIPGWGGTVRLSRMIGADHAIEWVALGKQYSAEQAFDLGVIDGVVESDKDLLTGAKTLLKRMIAEELDWKQRKEIKKGPLQLGMMEKPMVFDISKAFIKAESKGHYIAPLLAVESMEKGMQANRDSAIQHEAEAFIKCARSPIADSLIKVFLGDQYLKKTGKKRVKGLDKLEKVGVLGAGIMGGGIAYQTASRGLHVVMKDINQPALDLGLNEANKLLGKQIDRKKLTRDQAFAVNANIVPVLEAAELKDREFVVEAIIENEDIKKNVLAEMENIIPESGVLASNTSTISISRLAKSLKRPDKFCGVHFFNPVHKMPLVEIIKGEETSEETINKAVQYAQQIGKTPVVVNDCAGFLVNRILFPYFFGFFKLLESGASFVEVDKVMEKFGWPMGPAYLLDVVGIDTAHHCTDIMGEAFPDRMKFSEQTIAKVFYDQKRFGQKTAAGFYSYIKDKRGRVKKTYQQDVESLLDQVVTNKQELGKDEIQERMMLPMIFESIRCLDENIVASATELDMAMLLGLGFPPFRVGPIKFAQDWGLQNVIEAAKKYQELGALYHVPESLISKIEQGQNYY
jgi:3-hydroxyacyl-CoA dehydrogenase/enoyl-CoA hydratase/3-hydroxybutyryl-CoA epimerase/enoyl-CoA isomerase